jgi:hypothetical protein
MTHPTPEEAGEVRLPELPPVDTASLAHSGRDVDYINGYEAGYESAIEQMQAYARAAVLMERERAAKVCERLHEGQSKATWHNLFVVAAAAIRGGKP